ncbi:DUF6318 family protein [Brachybacterium sp. DNPG3]
MSRRTQQIIIAIVAAALVIPFGALGIAQLLGNDDQTQTESADGRASVDPADQPARPSVALADAPAEMTDQSAEGAESLVAYMLTTYTYMMTTGDTSVWEAGSDDNCSVCQTFISNAQILNDQGGYLVDGAFTIHSTSFSGAGDPPSSGTVTIEFTEEPGILVDDPTLTPYELEEINGTIEATVAWDGTAWKVGDMTLLDSDYTGQDSTASDAGGASDAGQ